MAVTDVGEDVVGVGSVLRATLVAEAGHVTGVVHGTRVVVTRPLVVVTGLVDKDLHVLIAIIALLSLETEGHAELGTGGLKISLGSSGGIVVVDCDRMVGLLVVTVSDFDFAAVNCDTFLGIDIIALDAGTFGETSGIGRQIEAADIRHLQFVAALGIILVIGVGIVSGTFPHLDGLTFVTSREDEVAAQRIGVFTVHLNYIVVLPGIGAQVHQSVFHRLGYCRVRTADGKRGCRAAGAGLDVPAILGPCRLSCHQCHECQHQGEDSVKFFSL